MGHVGGASGAEVVGGEGVAEGVSAVEVEVAAAGEDDAGGVCLGAGEERDGARRGGGEGGGELAEVVGVAVVEGAVDPADAVVVGDFDDETGGVVVGELGAELLIFFGGGFGFGLDAADGFGEAVGADGEQRGGLVEEFGVVAGGADGAEAGDVGEAEAAGDFLSGADEERADLAGGVDVCSSAGIAVVVFDFDDADGAVALGELGEFAGGEESFSVGAGDGVDEEGAVFGDEVVDDALDAGEVVGGEGVAVDVDGGEFGAEVEGYGVGAEAMDQGGGEQVLAGVLLHVIEAAGPVDESFHLGSGHEGLVDGVPDFAGFVLFDGEDGDFKNGSVAGGGAEGAGVVGLAAAGGVKGGAVEGDLPEGFAVLAGVLADVGDGGGEFAEEGVEIVEPLGHLGSESAVALVSV